MSNFSQKHTKISTLYLLNEDPPRMELELLHHSKWKKAVLIIPLLASEYTEPDNRPVFENIVAHLSSASYLSQIIFGLDRATEDDACKLADILNRYKVKNYLIQHNDGPGFSSIYNKLSEAGFRLNDPGKGKNMFMSFGIALAMGAHSIGLIDADIRTFSREQLDRLFYPVQVLNYQFSKAFYARIKDGQFYGRVKRLLLDPLLIALKRKFTETQEEKVLRLVDFLLTFNYQLSGRWLSKASSSNACSSPPTGAWRSSRSSRSTARPRPAPRWRSPGIPSTTSTSRYPRATAPRGSTRWASTSSPPCWPRWWWKRDWPSPSTSSATSPPHT